MAAASYSMTKGAEDESYDKSPPPMPDDRLNDHVSVYEPSIAEPNYAPSLPSDYASSNYSVSSYNPSTCADSSFSISPIKSTAEKPRAYTKHLASHTSPIKSPAKSSRNIYDRHPAYSPKSVDAGGYYTTSPQHSRAPKHLYNKDCGVPYKSIAAITKQDHILIQQLLNSEQVSVIEAICLYYHYRMNTIHSPTALSQAQIRGIFDVDVVNYQFSIHELYKRWSMRKGAMNNRNANLLNFYNLSEGEVRRFIEYLDRIGTWETAGKEIKLFSFGEDDNGLLFLKIKQNKFTQNIIQLLNSIHDNVRQWRSMVYRTRKLFSSTDEEYCYGVKWIEHTQSTPPFHFC